MAAAGIGDTVLRRVDAEGQLGPERRRQPHRPGRLGETDHAVEPVVIRERERVEAQSGRLLGQLLGMGRAVEEAEVGVAVQLGVGVLARAPGPGHVRRRLEGLTLAAPGRAVTTCVPRRAAGAAGPRHERIDPSPGSAPARPVPQSAASSSLHVQVGLLEPRRKYRTEGLRTKSRTVRPARRGCRHPDLGPLDGGIPRVPPDVLALARWRCRIGVVGLERSRRSRWV